MKQRFLLSFLFVFTCMVAAQAQIAKGSTWLGGSFGYGESREKSEGSTTGTKQKSFNISPAIGTAVKENLIVGVFVNYIKNTTKYGSTTDRTDKYYGGGIFIRKYFPIVNRIYIFGEGNAHYQGYRFTDNNIPANGGDLRTKGWSGGISLTPGLSYGITKNIQIETGLNSLFSASYQKRNIKNNFEETDNSSFGAGVSLSNASQLFIGFRFLINKKA
jgi:hypothetical protein